MKNDYFKELAKKVEVDVPKEVNQKILNQIPFKEGQPIFKWGLSFALAASLTFIIYSNLGEKPLVGGLDSYAISEMIENQEMYEQMDLLGQVEDVELTEEEWNILLNEDENDV